jgi:hypothetical protein
MADAQVKAREGRGAWSLLKRFCDVLQCRASGLPMKRSSCVMRCDAL